MTIISINSVLSMRIIKVASCPSNSGKATLTYHVGYTADNEIHFRVVMNTGGGLFSPEWLALNAIQPALAKAPAPLTSYPLVSLLQGKSTNTPAFLMAALKNEGLVRSLEGKVRGYELIDSAAFMGAVNALIASGVDIKVPDISADYKTSVALKKVTKPSKSVQSIGATQPAPAVEVMAATQIATQAA